MSSDRSPLRAITYLAPSHPLELFEILCGVISEATDREVQLAVEKRHSGPMHTDHDPFATDEVDIGFLCSPSYLYLRSRPDPSVALVHAGLVFDDPRNEGQPVYHSDVVVRDGHVATSFADLEGRVWGYNDTCSLSGYFSTCQKLRELGRASYFERQIQTGSHLRSLEAIVQRDIDAAAIDSNVLQRFFVENPQMKRQLRVLESWGPFPIQPIVLRSAFADLAAPIARALVAVERDTERARALRELGVVGLQPTSLADYEDERCEMQALGLIA